MFALVSFLLFFFFNDTATTEIYTLSLHDALPISEGEAGPASAAGAQREGGGHPGGHLPRSEEHTSELQSRLHLVCRLLLEKKKKKKNQNRERYDTNSSSGIRGCNTKQPRRQSAHS